MNNREFSNKVMNASKWSLFTEISAKLIGPISLIVLARFLTPDDFGVVTIATMVISFTQIFMNSGLHKAIIQTEEVEYKIEDIASVTFWSNIGLSICIFLVIFFIADPLSNILNEPRTANVIKVLAFQIIFSALGLVQTALFQRELKFEKLFWVRIVTVVAPTILSIPLAIYGMGYWAIVGGQIFGSLANTIVLWFITKWKPSFYFNYKIFKKLFSFGYLSIIEGIVGWLIIWLDVLIIGIYFSTNEIGLYRTASSFVNSIMLLLVSPIVPVLYSSLSRIQNNDDMFKKYFLQAQKLVFFISVTLGVIFLLFGDLIGNIIYGSNWEGIGWIISILGIAYGFKTLSSLNGEAYRAKGKPGINASIMLINLIIYIPAYIFAGELGLLYFVVAKAILMNFPQPIWHFYFSNKIFNVGFKDVFRNIKFIFLSGTIITFLVIVYYYFFDGLSLIRNTFIMPILFLLYLICLLPEKNFVINTVHFIKKTFLKNKQELG
ncbi:lipopolysaccharide biosynthesis protein [Peribacillus butanolivorans]|uniref:lipopolysaccharide biosynthesis protein n=1 Tax=Peribacillus butanolivorans TaxID=421767 RepID=UPI00363EB714